MTGEKAEGATHPNGTPLDIEITICLLVHKI